MDLGSPDKFSLDSSNLLKDDDFTVGKLDLNLAVSKEGGEGYGHESEECGDRTQVDLNHQHHVSSSMHAVVRNEKLESHSGRNDATEIMSVRYSDKSSSPVEAVNFHNDLEMGDPDCLPLRLPQEVDSNNQLEDMKEKSHCHEILIKSPDKSSGNLHHEKTESDCMVMEQEGTVHLMEKEYGGNEALIEDKYYLGKLIGGNEEMEGRNAYLHGQERTPIRSASPVRDISSSPESVPNLHGKLPSSSRGCHDSPNSLKTSRRKISPSPEIVDGNSRRVLSEDHQSPSARHMSPPSRRSGRESPRRDESLWKRLSSSPRRHQLSPDSRISDRSVSRSPRRSDSFYGSRRDHRDRLRSRSPYARSRHRRSPRRLSPRRRSPQGYHSRRRSPRRPWSPPHNRNNGVGRPGNNLFIAGFSFVTTERDLERKFSRFGRVRDVRIVRDKRSGDSRGFGFLSLERDEEADAAIRALDQTEWNGRVVLVEKSKSR